jgi:hypothetical protein
MAQHFLCRTLLVSFFALGLSAFSGAPGAQSAGGIPCAPDLAGCPPDGCAVPGTPDALLNRTKRAIPPNGSPTKLTLDDFFVLQDRASSLVGQNLDLDANARGLLRGLEVASTDGNVSEGDLVEIAGYVTGLPTRPKASGAESVNCRLSGPLNNDFHIPLVSDADGTEFEGIVVEMIPQGRDKEWTTRKLKRIAKESRLVIVRGQLFYDNEHRVNDDPDNVLGGEPKRTSLWEIHPVTEFFVCMTASKKCGSHNVNTQQWMRLEDIKAE